MDTAEEIMVEQEMAEVGPRQDRRKRNPSVMYTNGSSHRRKENRL